jgi:phage I-like protein
MKRENVISLHQNQLIGVSPCLFELNGHVPTEFRLLPTGTFKAKDGRPHGLPGWKIDATNASAVLDSIQQLDDKFLVDYDHQTLHTEKTGQMAKASAWIKTADFEYRTDDGLYATNVKWTAAAKSLIESEEYRYISPVLTYNKRTGEVTGVLMAALVNYPAIDGLTDLAAAHFNFNTEEGLEPMASKLGDLLSRLMKEKNITTEQMGTAAGIDAGTVSQILDGSIKRPPEKRLQEFSRVLGVSIESIKNALPEEKMNEALKALLGLTDDADDEQINTAVAALQARLDEVTALKANPEPDPSKFVPVETVTAMQQQIASLSNQINSKECGDLIEVALSDGRLLDAQKNWAKSLEVEALKAYLKDAQPIAALKGSQTGGKEPDETGENGLTQDEMAVCKATGIDVEEFKKSKGEK